MKAMQFSEVGEPEVLRPVEVPDPVPGAGQVLVRVESASVNFSDTARRRGGWFPEPTPLPFIPGGEVAGTVVALGEGVTTPAAGTQVFGLTSAGYAELALLDAASTVPVPSSLGSDAAAGLLLVGVTASIMLQGAARIESGETVFVPAASGGLANYAIQIAKLAGATVIGGASTPAKRDVALGYGADHVVDYTAEGWIDEVLALTGGHGVDVALEMTGPAHVTETLRILGPFGRLVVYGAAAGRDTHLDGTALESLVYDPAPGQALIGFNVGAWFQHRLPQTIALMEELIGRAVSGQITPPLLTTYPLAEAAEAHRLLESGQSRGKLILNP
ncbi:NADPH:quinone oxidoreductase family protein [Brachybacterium sp. FME24]|uniref:quinone oxidoreductase family protein n=1 Tax=Brachybacterium sp. FME24 TaxID=2742605 RepID=UPI001867F49F|nr:NADPH:quinone oxidoreductase family protein [Brachybacterium sp. FME24]